MSDKKNIGKNAQSGETNAHECIAGKPDSTVPDTKCEENNKCRTEKQRKEENKNEATVKETTENDEATRKDGDNSRTYSAGDIAAMIAEAEENGYRRGRNASIEELMRRPGIMERDTAAVKCSSSSHETPMILNRRHISIWDK